MYGNSFGDFTQYSASPQHQAPPPPPPPPQAMLAGQASMPQTIEERNLYELIAEKELVDPALHRVHAVIQADIDRESGRGEPEYIEIDSNKPLRVTKKVLIPIHKHPGFNFVGKLMGPGGGTLKKMQEKLGVKLSVMGRGSMRVASQEDECLASGDPKYAHLKERLQIRIHASGTPTEVYRKIADAIEELKPYLTPDSNDEIVQQQSTELGFNPQNRGAGGKSRRLGGGPSRGGRGGYHQGPPRGGGNMSFGTPPMHGRGPLPPSAMIPNGSPYMEAMPPMPPQSGMRGLPPFGGPHSRGNYPSMRGGFPRGAGFEMRGRYPAH